MSARYLIHSKADSDLENQAYYLPTAGNPETGHGFLVAAHQTFALLATHPNLGWHSRLKRHGLSSLRVFRVSGFETMLVLYHPRPDGVEVLRVLHGSRNLQALLCREGLE